MDVSRPIAGPTNTRGTWSSVVQPPSVQGWGVTPNTTPAHISVAAAVPSIQLSAAQRVSTSRGSVPIAGGGPIIPAAGGGTRILGAPQLPLADSGTGGRCFLLLVGVVNNV